MVAGKLLASLRDIVGTQHVVVDPEIIASYVVDWTGRYRGATEAVVPPRIDDGGRCRGHNVPRRKRGAQLAGWQHRARRRWCPEP